MGLKPYKIEQQGKYIVLNVLNNGGYVPLLMFADLPYFYSWVRGIADQCKDLSDLTQEIESFMPVLNKGGVVADYVNSLDKVDEIAKSEK